MARCYICGCELDNIKTKPEHIIPNGIGGKLKSREILCDKHNNELFELDQIICKDLEIFTNRLNPSRDNGKNPSTMYELSTGEKVIMQPNGEYYAEKPIIQVQELEDGKIQIQYSTYYSTGSQHKEHALNKLKSITEGICKKHGIAEEIIEKELNKINEAFEKNIKTDFNPVLMKQFQFNSSGKLFLGLSKIALDYYFYNKLSMDYVKEFLNKFKDKDVAFINKNTNYYYDDKLFLTDSIYHTLILKGDKANRLLYCIISLYGVLNCIVFLNKNFCGNDFLKTYSYDLRNKLEVIFNKNHIIKRDMAENLLTHKPLFNEIKKAQDIFMSFFKYGKNKEIEEDFKAFADKIQNEIKKLQLEPIINSSDEFKQILEEICEKNAKDNKTLKQFTKYELQELYEKFHSIITYEFYLQPYILQLTSDIFTKALTEIAVLTPQLLEDEDTLINKIFDFYSSVKTQNETINVMLRSNKSKVKEFIISFLPTIKPRLEFLCNLYK